MAAASHRVQSGSTAPLGERGAGEAEQEAENQQPVGEGRDGAVAVDVERAASSEKRCAKTPSALPSCPKLARPRRSRRRLPCHARAALAESGVGVDLELGADRARQADLAREDAVVVAILARALPHHDEVGAVARDVGLDLGPDRVGVDLELAGQRRSHRVEPPAEDAGRIAVVRALPDHDEAAVGSGGERGQRLRVGGVGVDLELGALGPALIDAPAEDAVATAVLEAAPDHDQLAGHGDEDARRPTALPVV